jgi:hypothetical protein
MVAVAMIIDLIDIIAGFWLDAIESPWSVLAII